MWQRRLRVTQSRQSFWLRAAMPSDQPIANEQLGLSTDRQLAILRG